MKILSFVEYYISLGFYLASHQAQKKVREYEKHLTSLFGESSPIVDSIYNPDRDGKEQFDILLSTNGFVIDWQKKLKKEVVEKEKETINADN